MNRFLTAEWRYLAMFNFAVDPAILAPLVPYGTELDFYKGEAFVSIVGFLFLDTRVLGVAVPLHRNFEEVNLRFYVERCDAGTRKRAVTFVQEMVPRRAIAFLANALYNERYRTARMRHRIDRSADKTDVTFEWKIDQRHESIFVSAAGDAVPLTAGSMEEFIAEHYWGYAAQRDGGTVEYAVEHAPWRIWPVTQYKLQIDFAALYGPQFAAALSATPRSVFLAEGSPVAVSQGRRIF